MKKGWDIPLTLAGLLALLLWLQPQVAVQTAAAATSAAAITLSGGGLLLCLVGLAGFVWFVVKYEGKQNGCVGPVLMLAGAAALIAFSVMVGG